jgi:ABC-type transport system involved in multi-copper enzyme maturation permease subunit
MIRLSWRQFRAQTAVAFGLLVAVALLFVATHGHLDHLYAVYAQANIKCNASSSCPGVSVNLGKLDQLLELICTALVVLPALVGVFWGAPLIAREFENGTHRLAWTQSVTRTRWLAAKLAVVGLGSVAVTGLLSLLVTWWSAPIDHNRSTRFASGLFGERDVVPLGYAAFGFALGVLAGLLIRHTLPAMASTIVVFLAARLSFTYAVRPNLFSPSHKSFALGTNGMGFGSTNTGPPTLMPNPPNLPNAWIYSTHIVDNAGHGLTSQAVAASCPNLALPPLPNGAGPGLSTGVHIRGPAPAGAQNALSDCVSKLGATYHELVTYQPATRYWLFQWTETAIFFVAALAIAGFCFWWLRNRAR